MPTYAYACTDCGHAFDVVQKFTDDALTTCPQCSGRLRKVYTSIGVTFKGSGFYRTDSRAGANSGADSGAKGSGPEGTPGEPKSSEPKESSSTGSSSTGSQSKELAGAGRPTAERGTRGGPGARSTGSAKPSGGGGGSGSAASAAS